MKSSEMLRDAKEGSTRSEISKSQKGSELLQKVNKAKISSEKLRSVQKFLEMVRKAQQPLGMLTIKILSNPWGFHNR